MTAKDYGDNEIRINRELEDVWKLVDNPEWFAKIFEGASTVTSASRAQVDIRQEVAGRWFPSSVIVENRDADRKKIKYRIGSARVNIKLKEVDDAGTSLEMTLEYEPSPPERVLQVLRTSMLGRLKHEVEDQKL